MKIENTLELRVLIECVRGGSLTAAARQLELTPAAASAALKKLESRLGARLVERSTRALRPTEAGARFIEYAQRALDLLDEGGAQAGDGGLRGRIRMSASSDLMRHVLLPLVETFLRRHPEVDLAVTVTDQLQDVMRDEVDLAIRYGALDDNRLVARKLRDQRRIACAAPAYLAAHGTPAHPAELARHACITFGMRNRREARWYFESLDGGGALEVRVRGQRSCDDGELAKRWAVAGGGIVYKSELDVRAELASGALLRLFPRHVGQHFPLHAVLPSNRFVPARVRMLVDHLAHELAGPAFAD